MVSQAEVDALEARVLALENYIGITPSTRMVIAALSQLRADITTNTGNISSHTTRLALIDQKITDLSLAIKELQGLTDLDALSDVDTTGVSDGNILIYSEDDETWLPQDYQAELALEDLTNVNSGAQQNNLLTYSGGAWNPLALALQLNDLTDVDTSPSSGNVLSFNGSQWINTTPSGLTLALDGITDVDIIAQASGQFLGYDGLSWKNLSVPIIDSLDQISDVDITSPTNDEVLTYEDGEWVNRPVTTKYTTDLDLYVDPVNGDDTDTGLASGNAWKTLEKATTFLDDSLVNGCIVTVHCAEGDYSEAMSADYDWRFPRTTAINSGAVRFIGDERHGAGLSVMHGDYREAITATGPLTIEVTYNDDEAVHFTPAAEGWGSGDRAVVQVNDVVYIAPIDSVTDGATSVDPIIIVFAAAGWTDLYDTPVATPDLQALGYGDGDDYRGDSLTFLPTRTFTCDGSKLQNMRISELASGYWQIRGFAFDRRTSAAFGYGIYSYVNNKFADSNISATNENANVRGCVLLGDTTNRARLYYNYVGYATALYLASFQGALCVFDGDDTATFYAGFIYAYSPSAYSVGTTGNFTLRRVRCTGGGYCIYAGYALSGYIYYGFAARCTYGLYTRNCSSLTMYTGFMFGCTTGIYATDLNYLYIRPNKSGSGVWLYNCTTGINATRCGLVWDRTGSATYSRIDVPTNGIGALVRDMTFLWGDPSNSIYIIPGATGTVGLRARDNGFIGVYYIAPTWTYADEAARLAAVGFLPADVGKYAYQESDDSYWALTDDAPITWAATMINECATKYDPPLNTYGNNGSITSYYESTGLMDWTLDHGIDDSEFTGALVGKTMLSEALAVLDNEGWQTISSSKYAAAYTAADLTITMSDTSDMAEGRPIEYTIGGTAYYGIIHTVALNTSIEFYGQPGATGNITSLRLGRQQNIVELKFHVGSTFGDDAADLLETDLGLYDKWSGPTAYIVDFQGTLGTADTGAAQPKMNFKADGNLVGTDDTNNGIELSDTPGTWVHATGLSNANSVLDYDDPLEVRCTVAGTNGDAEDLSFTVLVVVP